LYRLTGDLHPVHVDPEVARSSGFDRPILHGLCTLGITARAVAVSSGNHPVDLARLSARFTAPVYPGDELQVDSWRIEEGLAFETLVTKRGKTVQGVVAFSGAE